MSAQGEAVAADDKVPLTARGRRTRAKLVEAARTIFESHGYADARITDIAKTAGVAYGTFYTYFPTKEAIFREVARSVQQEMLSEPAGDAAEGDPAERSSAARSEYLYDRVARANRRYLASYQRNARLMAVIEQVALFSDELFEIRREVRRAFVERSTMAIARWQREGLADPDLDPAYAASALGSMVDRFAYVWFVLDGDFEMDKAVANLTRLWMQALGMSIDTKSPPR